jgi:hypothetical protein
MDGETVYFNPEGFRSRIMGAIQFKDLNPQINEQTLINLFKPLEERIASLEEADQILGYIRQTQISAFNSLKQNMTDNYLINLLKESGNPDEKASFQKAYLVAILNYILDQPNQLNEGAVLSQREEILLSVSNSIRECHIGKEEGIALTYNQLPQQYKYSRKETSHERIIERALEELGLISQSILIDLCSSENALMRAWTGEEKEPVNQLSHQALYIKNRIARDIGLDHEVQFDLHARLVYDQLLAKENEELLSIFYEHLDPHIFTKTLIQAFAKMEALALKNPKQFEYSPYQLFTELLLNQNPSREDLDKVWEFDDDGQLSLTEVGALEIWIAGGFLSKTAQTSSYTKQIEAP